MRKYFVNSLSLFSLLFLFGCSSMLEPKVFGVSQRTWEHMSESERHAVIEGYNRRKQTEAEYAPVESLIGVLGASLDSKNEKSFESEMGFSDFSSMNMEPVPAIPPVRPSRPVRPVTHFDPQDCVEINEVRDGVSYREVQCAQTKKKTSTSFSFE